jgi:hypothetical protein
VRGIAHPYLFEYHMKRKSSISPIFQADSHDQTGSKVLTPSNQKDLVEALLTLQKRASLQPLQSYINQTEKQINSKQSYASLCAPFINKDKKIIGPEINQDTFSIQKQHKPPPLGQPPPLGRPLPLARPSPFARQLPLGRPLPPPPLLPQYSAGSQLKSCKTDYFVIIYVAAT